MGIKEPNAADKGLGVMSQEEGTVRKSKRPVWLEQSEPEGEREVGWMGAGRGGVQVLEPPQRLQLLLWGGKSLRGSEHTVTWRALERTTLAAVVTSGSAAGRKRMRVEEARKGTCSRHSNNLSERQERVGLGGNRGHTKKYWDSGYILRESTGVADGLIECGVKGKSQGWFWGFWPEQWKDGVATYWGELWPRLEGRNGFHFRQVK